MPRSDLPTPAEKPCEIELERDFLAQRLAELEELLRDEFAERAGQRFRFGEPGQYLGELYQAFDRTENRDKRRGGAVHGLQPAPDGTPRWATDSGHTVRLRSKPQTLFVPRVSGVREIWVRSFSPSPDAATVVELRILEEAKTASISKAAGAPVAAEDPRIRSVQLTPGVPVRLFTASNSKRRTPFTLRRSGGPKCHLQFDLRSPTDCGETHEAPLSQHGNPWEGQALLRAGEFAAEGRSEAAIAFAETHASEFERPAIHLLRANDAIEDDARWLAHLNRYVASFGLTPIELLPEGPTRFMRLTAATPRRIESGPRVSVLMCAYNAEQTLAFAAESILRQTWRPLELIIVDDASTDRTVTIARELAHRDPRVKLHRNACNVGSYVSKSIGATLATGQYLTSHDADDWAHPERIERHIGAMLADGDSVKVSRASMLRVTQAGEFRQFFSSLRRSPDGALKPAMISCLFEMDFFRERLGSWDSVRFGADSEMFYRAERILGSGCRHYDQLSMLTLNAETSVSRHSIYGHKTPVGVSPLRRRYRDGYRAWHEGLARDTARLPLPHPRGDRRFPSPAAFCVLDHQIEQALQGLPEANTKTDRDAPFGRSAGCSEEAEQGDPHPAEAPHQRLLQQECDSLAVRVAEEEDRLRRAYEVRAAETKVSKKLIPELFVLFEAMTKRREKPLAQIRQLLRREDSRSPGTTNLWGRSPFHWPGVVGALVRGHIEIPSAASIDKSDKPRVRTFGTASSAVRIRRKPQTFFVPAGAGVREVWVRSFGASPGADTSVELQILGDLPMAAIANLAGEPLVAENPRIRRIQLWPGVPVLLFTASNSKRATEFTLRRTGGRRCLLQIEHHRGTPAVPFPAKALEWWTKPREGRTLILARELSNEAGRADAIAFAEAHASKSERPAIDLLRANQAIDDDAQWLAHVNHYVARFGLAPIELLSDAPTRFLRLTAGVPRKIETGPLVSVVMCAYNAEQTLAHAAESILRQTWQPLELIIVDDASTDGTVAIARDLVRRDPRVKLHRNGVNVGCDVTKSIGATLATGRYLTSHDADDWAHPERIERHMEAMRADGDSVKVSRSCMLRVTHDGEFRQFTNSLGRSRDGALRPAMISCLFEMDFFRKRLGSWDSVRFGADSEMYYRAKKILGSGCRHYEQLSLLMLDVETSESYNPAYGRYGADPSSSAYRAGFAAWHETLTSDTAFLPLPHPHTARRFPAPGRIVVPDFRVEQALRGAPECGDESPQKRR